MAMTFGRRLQLFSIGAFFGFIVVYFLVLRDRSFLLTPSKVIQKRLVDLPIHPVDTARCKLNCVRVDEKTLKELLAGSEVDFSESAVRRKPGPLYTIYLKDNNKGIESIRIEMLEGEFVLHDLSLKGSTSCICP